MKYFSGSIFVTIIGLLCAYLWGEHVHPGSGLLCIFIATILSVLEVSLSFDNAVVNAMKLEKLPPIWRHRFLTWGIIIAVFGMRFLFPVLVVAIFAKLSMLNVAQIAISDVDRYASYLEQTHAPIITFGGAFLFMLFLNYFCSNDKDVHWIKCIEEKFICMNKISGIKIVIPFLLVLCVAFLVPAEQKIRVLISGCAGMLIYLLIDELTKLLEKKEQLSVENCVNSIKCTGLMGFIYLELIDASFSLDGVLGAFALSKDIIIITIGLAIGAMFVRSLTILLVEKKTLAQFRYLEHGAHWAIGALALIMFVSTIKEVPEVVTGLIGFVFILMAFISSIMHNKKIKN